MSLHIVSKSPFSSTALSDCLDAFAEGDALLLIEDGVYALSGRMSERPAVQPVYCLAADAAARGLQIPDSVTAVDDAGWVALCAEHNPVVSWFK
ncbi:tRNA 2-thiouridine synthesizing protein B [Microbulbifer donghaiensis]|uniref:tRNA 2-thiouridine synthesizing protein B n=1 Tax=Microbulbifer donghaiensis TaxID=494016 RepID=A0A1M4VBA3_9GAMM|nr:sulfurtransferase complex subunit TusB [Microbulbifer donghaiensis]SHE66265.1 tRNA 2-thiouridine synthesizing protein B [Microbulbifer donghaiensis]